MRVCPSPPTRLKITPVTRTLGSKVASPCTTAAAVRAIPPASTTSNTGASSSTASSAPEPVSSVGDHPSNSPITPSTSARSPPDDPRRNEAITPSGPVIHASRLRDGWPLTLVCQVGSR